VRADRLRSRAGVTAVSRRFVRSGTDGPSAAGHRSVTTIVMLRLNRVGERSGRRSVANVVVASRSGSRGITTRQDDVFGAWLDWPISLRDGRVVVLGQLIGSQASGAGSTRESGIPAVMVLLRGRRLGRLGWVALSPVVSGTR